MFVVSVLLCVVYRVFLQRLGTSYVCHAPACFKSICCSTSSKTLQHSGYQAVWHTNDDDRQLPHMQICPKRTQLELILQEDPNIVLYISAITGLEKQKLKGKKTVAVSNDTENLVEELSQDSAVSEEQSVEPPLGTLNAYSGVAFWITFDTPLCTVCDFENRLEKAFLKAGVNIYECKIVKPRSTKTKNVSDPVEHFTSALSQVIKDHNWPCAIDIAKESAVNFVKTFSIETLSLCKEFLWLR